MPMTERRKKSRAGSPRKQVAGAPAREAGPGDYAREAMQQWGRAVRLGASAAKPVLAKAVADLPERAERIRSAGGALRDRLGAAPSEPEAADAPEPEEDAPEEEAPDDDGPEDDGPEDDGPPTQPEATHDGKDTEEEAEDVAEEDDVGGHEARTDSGENGEPEHAYSEAVEEIEHQHHEAYAEVLE